MTVIELELMIDTTELNQLLTRLEREREAALAQAQECQKAIDAVRLVIGMLNPEMPIERPEEIAASEEPAEEVDEPVAASPANDQPERQCPHCGSALVAYGFRENYKPCWYCRPCNKTIVDEDFTEREKIVDEVIESRALPVCADCGGPRSASSGKRCRACFKKKADANTTTRGEVQCPKCQTACGRNGKGHGGKQMYLCRNQECRYGFAEGTKPRVKDLIRADADKQIAESQHAGSERSNAVKQYQQQAREKYRAEQEGAAVAENTDTTPLRVKNLPKAACGICTLYDDGKGGKMVGSQPHCPKHGTLLKDTPRGFGESILNP